MSALTSIRTRLTENPQGLTRDEIYSKVHFEAPKDIALALNQLKQADQIVEQDGRYFLKEMLGQGAAVPPKTSHTPASKVLQTPKAEKKPESFPIEKTHLSTAAQVSKYLLDEFVKDSDRWIPTTEINRVCSDGTKKGNQRVSVALSSMKAQGKIVPKGDERGYYRWKKPAIFGQVFVPMIDVSMVDVLKDAQPPTVEILGPAVELESAAPEVIDPATSSEPETPAAPETFRKIHPFEDDALKDYLAKSLRYIKTGSDEARIDAAVAWGRLQAAQDLMEAA